MKGPNRGHGDCPLNLLVPLACVARRWINYADEAKILCFLRNGRRGVISREMPMSLGFVGFLGEMSALALSSVQRKWLADRRGPQSLHRLTSSSSKQTAVSGMTWMKTSVGIIWWAYIMVWWLRVFEWRGGMWDAIADFSAELNQRSCASHVLGQ